MKRLMTVLVLLALVACFDAGAAGYRTTVGTGDDAIPLVVVSGTPYEMGRSLGELMKHETVGLWKRFLGGARTEDPEKYSDARLDEAWEMISPYVSKRWVEELRGLAEGSGLPFEYVRRGHMIPAVSEYACSGAALWGKATRGDSLYQFRNLDYEMRGGLQDYPAVVIYLPDEGIPHVNVTFAGVIGVNTGMNAHGIGLTEMGDSPTSEYPFDLDGIHFMMLFRDILYDADDIDEAVKMVQDAKRTKRYHYIIGDGRTKRGVKMLAHAPDLIVWDDNDATDEVAPNVFEGIVYNCENRDPIGVAHMKRYYGRYDAEAVIQLSAAVGSLGGNLLNVVYDCTNLDFWVSYAHNDECAFRRAYIHIDMNDYLDFSKKPANAVVAE